MENSLTATSSTSQPYDENKSRTVCSYTMISICRFKLKMWWYIAEQNAHLIWMKTKRYLSVVDLNRWNFICEVNSEFIHDKTITVIATKCLKYLIFRPNTIKPFSFAIPFSASPKVAKVTNPWRKNCFPSWVRLMTAPTTVPDSWNNSSKWFSLQQMEMSDIRKQLSTDFIYIRFYHRILLLIGEQLWLSKHVRVQRFIWDSLGVMWKQNSGPKGEF